MTTAVAVVVRCSSMAHRVFSSLRTITQGPSPVGAVILVTDDETPAVLHEWLNRLGEARGIAVVHAAGANPGAAWNAGIRAASAGSTVLLMNAGDELDAGLLAAAIQELNDGRSADLVATGVVWTGPGARRERDAPSGYTVPDLVGNSDLPRGASLVRRSVWEALKGFDETLPCLEMNEFWLRALSGGKRGAAAGRICLTRARDVEGLHRQAWDPERRADALSAILAKHRDLFAANLVAALFSRSQRLHALGAQYRSAISGREAMQSETARLKARIDELREPRVPIDFGDLRRTTPVSRDWGYERGTPVDRFYIEEFLDQFAPDIRGAVLEVQEADYTRRFGGDRVSQSDVVDLSATNPRATIVSDLRCAANIASHTYDCIILTQTIHVIDDMSAVLRECERILKPGGVLLATLPSASRVCLEYGDAGDHWRVTEGGARALLSGVFPPDALRVAARGNALVNAAFLFGAAVEDLTPAELAAVDPYFPLVVTVRAQKSASVRTGGRARRGGHPRGAAVLLYHRVAEAGSDVHALCVSPREFTHHLDVLTDRYQLMGLDELAAATRNGDAPPGAIALTFDDGYLDNSTVASPLLEAYGVPATFFLTTDGLVASEDHEYWWDTLERALLMPNAPRPGRLVVDLDGHSLAFEASTAAARVAAHRDIYDRIVGASASIRDSVVQQVQRWSGVAGDGVPRRLRREEVETLAARPGHAIGAHSVRHLMLPRQSAAVEVAEISHSRRDLEQVIGRPVRAFAYPFGVYGDSTVRAVAAASFDIAVSCDQQSLTERAHRLRLPRLDVTRRKGLDFEDWLAICLTAAAPASPE